MFVTESVPRVTECLIALREDDLAVMASVFLLFEHMDKVKHCGAVTFFFFFLFLGSKGTGWVCVCVYAQTQFEILFSLQVYFNEKVT